MNRATLLRRLAKATVARGTLIATAESCTGGMIAAALTETAGSSQWFDRAFIAYSNDAKQEMLGVSAATLAQHGAVSAATVTEMARHALERSEADLAVAVSGIAGPTGGSEQKPVGTVWIAWAGSTPDPLTLRFVFTGDRAAVREQTVTEALIGLLDCIETEAL